MDVFSATGNLRSRAGGSCGTGVTFDPLDSRLALYALFPWGPVGPMGKTKFRETPVPVGSAVTAASRPEKPSPRPRRAWPQWDPAVSPRSPLHALFALLPLRALGSRGANGQNKIQGGPVLRRIGRYRRVTAGRDGPLQPQRGSPLWGPGACGPHRKDKIQ